MATRAIVFSLLPVGISPKQFSELQQRTVGNRKAAVRNADASRESPGQVHQIILGVDPSLRGTGYGVIQLARPFPKTLAQGTIKCPVTWEHSRCLVSIASTLREVIAKTAPTVCIVEGIFFAQNLKTAIVMGQARGAALVAAGEAGLTIYEIATRKVKQAIVGYGAAQKSAVARMVQRMLNLSKLPEPDAADALALALTHAQGSNGVRVKPLKAI